MTLLCGNNFSSAAVISLESSGYLLSHVMRKRVALPLGHDKLPSPKATPITYASVAERLTSAFYQILIVPREGLEPSHREIMGFESIASTNSAPAARSGSDECIKKLTK